MALLNRFHLRCLVSIEIKEKGKFKPIATGFLVGFVRKKSKDPEKRSYSIFLVSNRHVFEGKDRIWLRFNKKASSQAVRFEYELQNKWLAHKDPAIDLAMLTVSPAFLNRNKVEWAFYAEEQLAFQKDFDEIGISLGDDLFVLGFPMGRSGLKKNYAIVRGGLIARIDREIIKQEKAFLVDTLVFPGNSGGPVLTKPEVASLDGTKAVSSVYVLGAVSRYISYKEPLFSHQSQPPSLGAISIENSGLAFVVPMDYAKQICQDFLKKRKKLEAEQKGQEKSIGK